MKKINLKNVTLCTVAGTRVDQAISALKKSMEHIDFYEALLITHEIKNLEKDRIRVINTDKLNYKGYNNFVFSQLDEFIKTDFVLLIQDDGYVIHPNKWDDDFLNYDYIGAPWPAKYLFSPSGKEIRVGNGGFSLRSKKLLGIVKSLGLNFETEETKIVNYHEDTIICSIYRDILEKNSIKFAPPEVATRFSKESWCHDSKFITFGFHKFKPGLFDIIPFLIKKLRNVMNEERYIVLEKKLQKVRSFFKKN